MRDDGFKIDLRDRAWRRKWKPTPIFLPGKSHGQRTLVGYSPRGCNELDTTKETSLHWPFKKRFANRWFRRRNTIHPTWWVEYNAGVSEEFDKYLFYYYLTSHGKRFFNKINMINRFNFKNREGI